MILIKNAHVVDAATHTDEVCCVLIKDGKIVAMETMIDEKQYANIRVIDAGGHYVLPGLVDVHVHFRDPGFLYKEDILTGARAAAAGGVTSVVLMANTRPVVDDVGTLRYVLEKGKKTDIHVHSCASITRDLKGKQLTDMALLQQAGAAGFTDDGVPILDAGLLREAMQEAARLGAVLSLHEEDPAYITNNGIDAGSIAAAHYGIRGSDRQAEIRMIDRDLELALETGAVLNIQHISTREGVELVRQAKKNGKNIHAEATPHHFTLTQEAVIRYGTLAKMNPPLRTSEDREAIIEGLRDGTIDLIATDHAPHSKAEKAGPITLAPSGIIGLETALPLAVTNLVREGRLTMQQLVERMCLAPAQLYGLDAGRIYVGKEADLVILN
ncbi:MAG: dihydroorotase, partial [Lachnospiraceae bacterium]|nr:dihydroorotase [Lachnospiraceae bacterium]